MSSRNSSSRSTSSSQNGNYNCEVPISTTQKTRKQQLEKSNHKRKDIAPIALTHVNYLEKLPKEERKAIVFRERMKRLLFFEELVPSPVETDEDGFRMLKGKKRKTATTATAGKNNDDEDDSTVKDSNTQMQLLTLAYLTSLGKYDYLCKKTELNEVDRELNSKLMDLDLFVRAVFDQSAVTKQKNQEQDQKSMMDESNACRTIATEKKKNKESGSRRIRNQ